MVKIGLIYSGILWQKLLASRIQRNIELLSVCRLLTANLNEFDVIIIPRDTNQEILHKVEKEGKIKDFLDNGNVLICFGECFTNWLPASHWSEEYLDEVYIVDDKHPIFRGVGDQELSNWYYSAHGFFSDVPRGARVLLADRTKKKVMMFLDEEKTFPRGVILASTMDPDLHAYAETVGRKTGQGARQLLDNIFDWAVNKAIELREKHPKKMGVLHHLPFPKKLFAFYSLLVASLLVIIVINVLAPFSLNQSNTMMLSAVASFFAIISALLSIHWTLKRL